MRLETPEAVHIGLENVLFNTNNATSDNDVYCDLSQRTRLNLKLGLGEVLIAKGKVWVQLGAFGDAFGLVLFEEWLGARRHLIQLAFWDLCLQLQRQCFH